MMTKLSEVDKSLIGKVLVQRMMNSPRNYGEPAVVERPWPLTDFFLEGYVPIMVPRRFPGEEPEFVFLDWEEFIGARQPKRGHEPCDQAIYFED
jgi:hypothetical protein